jgi:hypothetical protein
MLVLCETCAGPAATEFDVRDALLRGIARCMREDPAAIVPWGGHR